MGQDSGDLVIDCAGLLGIQMAVAVFRIPKDERRLCAGGAARQVKLVKAAETIAPERGLPIGRVRHPPCRAA